MVDAHIDRVSVVKAIPTSTEEIVYSHDALSRCGHRPLQYSLMMDEPSLGLVLLLVKEIFNIIQEIHKQGVIILLIEQNANAALHIADVGYVMETGRIILKGTGEELFSNNEVKKLI